MQLGDAVLILAYNINPLLPYLVAVTIISYCDEAGLVTTCTPHPVK